MAAVFGNCPFFSFTSIIIPDSVTEIGERAFSVCVGLTTVTIGSGVQSIGDWAFDDCEKLVEVWNYSDLQIEEGSEKYGRVGCYAIHVYNTNEKSKQTKSDDGYLFYEEEKSYLLGYVGTLTDLTLPEKSPKGNNYEIYQHAFCMSSGLTTVTIGSGVTSIWKEAFYGCSGLTSITIGSGVTSIKGALAFFGCGRLTNVVWNAENCMEVVCTSSRDGLFDSCKKLTGVTFGENVKVIPNNAFTGCKGLTSIEIPNGMISIGEHAFGECSGLTGELKIPDSVTSIGEEAFSGCSGLTSVTIGSGVTSIGYRAFMRCSRLKEVHFANPNRWTAGNKVLSELDDPATAAKYLTSSTYYCDYNWKRAK